MKHCIRSRWTKKGGTIPLACQKRIIINREEGLSEVMWAGRFERCAGLLYVPYQVGLDLISLM